MNAAMQWLGISQMMGSVVSAILQNCRRIMRSWSGPEANLGNQSLKTVRENGRNGVYMRFIKGGDQDRRALGLIITRAILTAVFLLKMMTVGHFPIQE